MSKNCDLYVSGSPGGSVYLLTPVSEAGQEFIDNRIPEDAQFLGKSVAVEFRYIDLVVEGARSEGYDVRVASNLVN